MSELLTLDHQPNFPGEDLTEKNAALLPEVLDLPSIEGQAHHLTEYQRALYVVAHNALLLKGMKAVDSKENFQAFTEGYAALEAMMFVVTGTPSKTIVTPREYNQGLAVERTFIHHVGPGYFADYEMSERIDQFVFERPRIVQTIVETGKAKDKDIYMQRARIMGGQIAAELQRPHFEHH